MRFFINGLDFPFDNPLALRHALVLASHRFGERLDGHLDTRCTLLITHAEPAGHPAISGKDFSAWLLDSGVPMVARGDCMGSYEYFFNLTEELGPYAAAWSRLERLALRRSVIDPGPACSAVRI